MSRRYADVGKASGVRKVYTYRLRRFIVGFWRRGWAKGRSERPIAAYLVPRCSSSLATSQIFTAPPECPVANRTPSGLKATLYTSLVSSTRLALRSAVDESQSFISPRTTPEDFQSSRTLLPCETSC